MFNYHKPSIDSEIKEDNIMPQEDIIELHNIMQTWLLNKGYNQYAALAFLSCTFVGTMAMAGYSEDFFDRTCEMMKEKFKNHPERKLT